MNYSAEHYRRVSPPPESERDRRLRLADAEAREKASADADELFGRVSNSDEARARHDYWSERLRYWRDVLGCWA